MSITPQANADLLTTARWHFMNRSTLPWGGPVSDALLALVNDKLGFPAPATPLSPIAPLPPIDSEHLIALCLGHGRAGDEGNVGAGGVSEEEYNLPLIEGVAERLRKQGFKVVVIPFYQGNGYDAAMVWLAKELKRLGVTAAIEFHFNAYDKKARGHEVLYWKNSKRGVTLAEELLQALDEDYPDHPSRGLKSREATDRGALFLSLTHCPAAIIEPFFGDNPAEWNRFDDTEEVERLESSIARGIATWAKKGLAA